MSAPPSSPAAPADAAATDALDRSCCVPVLLLFFCALTWLLIGAAFALVAAIKLHAPEFLAACPWLTYGRVQPAGVNAFLYGFATQAALGVTLWLLCRLGRAPLQLPWLVIAATLLWNAGVKIGLLGILAGESTGYEWLEMPRSASPILFWAYALIGLCALLTFHARQGRALYVSQWYLLAALLWFAWSYSAANLLLVFAPVRGVVQALVNGWFKNNLAGLWLAPVALAAVFYFLPKLLARPLHNHYLALFGFWTLALFGSWGGLPAGAPFPAWVVSLSQSAAVLMTVPLVAVAVNLFLTAQGEFRKLTDSMPLRFMAAGVVSYLLAGALTLVAAGPLLSEITFLTHFTSALTQLGLNGFFSLVIFGAIYAIVPRLLGQDWPSEKLVRAHLGAATLGVAAQVIGLAAGGGEQGLALNNPAAPFLDAVKAARPFLQLATLGELLWAIGALALFVNLVWMLARCCCACCCLPKTDPAGVAPPETAEVAR